MVSVLPILKQLLATISCNLLVFSSFAVFGWATINSNELQHQNSTFPTGPLTFEEVSSVISLSSIGSLIGNFAVLPFIHWIGPKSTNHFFTIPLILSALLIVWAQNIYFLYVSRILSGMVTGGLAVSVLSFATDISSNNIRGVLNAIYDTSENSGLIASFLLGNYLKPLDQAKVYLILPGILIFLLFAFRESPEFWLRNGNHCQVKKSLKFYKGIQCDTENNNGAVEKDLNDEKENDAIQSSKLTLKEFLTPQARKAFRISISLTVMFMLCGTVVLIDYSAEIFARTGSSLSPKSSSLLISVTKLAGNLIFLLIVEQFSRKTLFMGSTIVSAIFFFLFGIYCLLWLHRPEFDWMPPFYCGAISFASGMGLSQMPFIISTEIFPKKIRSICISFTLCFVWINLFVIEFVLPVLLDLVDLSGCLIIFGTMCSLSAIFGSYMIPDTRGKSYDEIMQMLSK